MTFLNFLNFLTFISKNSSFYVCIKFKEERIKNIFFECCFILAHMFLFLGEIKFDGTTGKLKLDLIHRLDYQQGQNSLYSLTNVKKGYSFLSSNGEFKKFCKWKRFCILGKNYFA